VCKSLHFLVGLRLWNGKVRGAWSCDFEALRGRVLVTEGI